MSSLFIDTISQLLKSIYPTEPPRNFVDRIERVWASECGLNNQTLWELQTKRLAKIHPKSRGIILNELLLVGLGKLTSAENEQIQSKLTHRPSNEPLINSLRICQTIADRLTARLHFPISESLLIDYERNTDANIGNRQKKQLNKRCHQLQLWILHLRASNYESAVLFLIPKFLKECYAGFDDYEQLEKLYPVRKEAAFWLFAYEHYIPVAKDSVAPDRAMHILVNQWRRKIIQANHKKEFDVRAKRYRNCSDSLQLGFDINEVLAHRITLPIETPNVNEPIPAEHIFYLEYYPTIERMNPLLNRRQHDVLLVQAWHNLTLDQQDTFFERCHERLAAHYTMNYDTDYVEEFNILQTRRRIARLAQEYEFPDEPELRMKWKTQMYKTGMENIFLEMTTTNEDGTIELRQLNDLKHSNRK